ncbi:MAG: Rieske (2Fe-2S) protein [Actinomycetota bacterium]|nr:Rieske (2Fe-2S) protein [Actinomycetota bacterium]
MKRVVCRHEELGPGQMRVVWKGRAPVVVVCSESNDYYAVRGICPHQGGMLGAGQLTSLTASDEPGMYGLVKHGEVLRCPWHSFDYDVKTGRCISDARLRVRTYPVEVEGDHLVVDL